MVEIGLPGLRNKVPARAIPHADRKRATTGAFDNAQDGTLRQAQDRTWQDRALGLTARSYPTGRQVCPARRLRRGARVVDWDGLENRCALAGTVGSNPTLSAKDVFIGDRQGAALRAHRSIAA